MIDYFQVWKLLPSELLRKCEEVNASGTCAAGPLHAIASKHAIKIFAEGSKDLLMLVRSGRHRGADYEEEFLVTKESAAGASTPTKTVSVDDTFMFNFDLESGLTISEISDKLLEFLCDKGR